MDRKEKKMTKFCVITTQRSGSNWLIQLINSHPDLKALGEIFIERKFGRKWLKDKNIVPFYEFAKTNSGSRRLKQTFNYMELLNNYPGCHKAIGFKVMYNQIKGQPSIFLKIVLDNFKIIHLVRQNYLDIILSKKNAWGKGKKGIVWTKEKVEIEPIYLEPQSLLKEIYEIEFQQKLFKNIIRFLPNPVMLVTYESLLKERDKILDSISTFLRVKNSGITYNSSLVKISQGTYKDKIANYEEVKSTLYGTRFESFLNENKSIYK